MNGRVRVDPSDATPIWAQIERQLRLLVASGVLAPTQAVPSVRELARELTVNPATVSKAYQRLTAAGLFTVRRGEGTFVSDRLPAIDGDTAEREMEAGARRYASVAQALGASLDDAQSTLRSSWTATDSAQHDDVLIAEVNDE